MSPVVRSLYAVLALIGAAVALFIGACFLVKPPGPEPVAGVRNAELHELPGADREPWSVVFLSDVQNGIAYLPEIFERSKAFSPKAIVITGDFAATYLQSHIRIPVWYLRRSPPPAPTFIAPGNHDIAPGKRQVPLGNGTKEFVQWYGATTFDFRIGATRFLGLNNSEGPLAPEAIVDLKKQLEDAKARNERSILCLHRDVITFASEVARPSDQENHELLELIRGYEIPYVFCGHLHEEAYEKRGKTEFVAAPASGNRPALEPGQKPVRFLVLHWDGAAFHLRREEFYRRNSTELSGVFVYLALAEVRPLFEKKPALGGAILGVALLLFAAGSVQLLRRPKGAA
jgi:3',5'-cyclic AMP phosphodiesterase CpdA